MSLGREETTERESCYLERPDRIHIDINLLIGRGTAAKLCRVERTAPDGAIVAPNNQCQDGFVLR